jgi:hypothetical protein
MLNSCSRFGEHLDANVRSDERLGIENYQKMIQFYAQLVKNYAGNGLQN